MAQDVGDADPTASPLQGNSHLQPPLHHPDVSVPWGVGYSQSLLIPLSTGSSNSQEKTEDDLGVEASLCGGTHRFHCWL